MFFLDIEIEFMNGVQVGRFIREKLQDDNTLIVYMSSYTKYAMELFEVRPMDFLIKPLNEKKIIKALETGTKLLHKGEVSFQYKQGRNWNKIYIRNIIYFKAKDREVEMITQNGTITFYEALESIYEKFQIIGFCSFYNTVNDCGRFGSMDRIDHLPVFLSDTETTDCPFGCIIIDRNIPICEKYPEIFFLIQCIANSITKFILLGHIYSF